MGFDEFLAEREARRAIEARSRVTWRRVSEDTGGGYSGIGHGGHLAYVVRRGVDRVEFGRVIGRERRPIGTRQTVALAKKAAAEHLSFTREES